MASLQIRELPADIYAALSEKAKREGRSLAQQAIVELRRLHELEARNRRLQVLDRVAARPPDPVIERLDPVKLIREDRDA